MELSNTPSRELTEIEKQFVQEAVAGHFDLCYDETGNPIALGANSTDDLFSMYVVEERNGETSFYSLEVNNDGDNS